MPGGSLSGRATSPSLSGAGDASSATSWSSPPSSIPRWPRRPSTRGAAPVTRRAGLLESGAITEDELCGAAERYGLDQIDLSDFAEDDSGAGLLREHAARRDQAAPVGFTDEGTLMVAVSDPRTRSDHRDRRDDDGRGPCAASRSQIDGLLDALDFMEEPVVRGPQTITGIVPPEEEASDEGTQAIRTPPCLARPRLSPRPRRGARARARRGQGGARRRPRRARGATAELRGAHDEALRETRKAADREAAKAEAEHDGALADLKGAQELALAEERARRTAELESERGRTGSAIDAERERQQKELEGLRVRSGQVLEDECAAAAKELERERERHEQVLTEEQARGAEKLSWRRTQASELKR